MHIGVFAPQGWRFDLAHVKGGHAQWQAMLESTREAERLGYDAVWLFDHFHTIPVAKVESTFECWMTTAALAAATSRIRIGQMVTCNYYRNPALLAKMASTVDAVSNGRLDFGLGAGWYMHEATAYGYGFEKPAVRIGELDEALQIIKGMFTTDEFQFEGKYYKIGQGHVKNFLGQEMELAGAINQPGPVQRPHPPIWVGGGGEQLTLRTVARHADWANYFAPSLDATKHKNELLDKYCQEAGRDPSAVKRSVCFEVDLRPQDQVDKDLQALGWPAGTAKRWLTGSASQVVETLARYRDEARIEGFSIFLQDATRKESLQQFAEEVMRPLRGAAVGQR